MVAFKGSGRRNDEGVGRRFGDVRRGIEGRPATDSVNVQAKDKLILGVPSSSIDAETKCLPERSNCKHIRQI